MATPAQNPSAANQPKAAAEISAPIRFNGVYLIGRFLLQVVAQECSPSLHLEVEDRQ